MMKPIIGLTLIAALALASASARAERIATETTETVTTSSTSYDGTISEFDSDWITVRSESQSDPVRYRFSETTRYVDPDGNSVDVSTIRSGVPVTIYYDQQADDRVASKVVVRETKTEERIGP